MKVIPFTGTKENKRVLTHLFKEHGCQTAFQKNKGALNLIVQGVFDSATLPLGTWLAFCEDTHHTLVVLKPQQVLKLVEDFVNQKYHQWFDEGENNHE